MNHAVQDEPGIASGLSHHEPKGPAPREHVLVVEDEAYVRDSLAEMLASRGFDVSAAASVAEAQSTLARLSVDVVLSDLNMPGVGGLELLRALQASSPEVPVVIFTDHRAVASAVECLNAGASDFILKPAGPDGLEIALRRVLETRKHPREMKSLHSASATGPGALVGESAAWTRVMAKVEAAAPTDSTVLLLGESGTGKDLLARRLHQLSPRASAPFVRVSCAAVRMETWESELFGHRKGAFTGATNDREGRFRLADRGTLLLDEIGAMPLAGQAKLLHVLQDGEFHRVGDGGPTRVDVRIVASTNSDIAAEVRAGRFRPDLFHRLNVIRIGVPPLRERREDIIPLAGFFVREVATRLGWPVPAISPRVLARLRLYPWPGNVREVKSVIERTLVLDPVHGLEGLELGPLAAPLTDELQASEPGPLNLRETMKRLERDLLIEAARRSGGIRKEAARLLGIDPRNLAYYARKHRLAVGDES